LGWRTKGLPNDTYDVYLAGELDVSGKVYKVESQHYAITIRN
jgi:hypothetical protein